MTQWFRFVVFLEVDLVLSMELGGGNNNGDISNL